MTAPSGELADPAPRFGQVLVDVGAQRLQWGHIDDADLIRKRRRQSFPHELIDRIQEGRERFARARWGCNERVTSVSNRSPAATLRGRRLAKGVGKPAGDDRVETG
jgi:hypothetical protein